MTTQRLDDSQATVTNLTTALNSQAQQHQEVQYHLQSELGQQQDLVSKLQQLLIDQSVSHAADARAKDQATQDLQQRLSEHQGLTESAAD